MIGRRVLLATMAVGLAAPRLTVADPPGGAMDLAGRLIADAIGAQLG
jgi:tripartite-type tricarboxylate transporter receptor subunit TctC